MPLRVFHSLVDSRNVHTIRRDFVAIAVFIAIIWIVFAFDRSMPFLHGDLSHIIGNTIPLAVTLLLLAGSRANSSAIVFLITILAGAGLWVFGREALHIGASGLVFGLIAFHICSGFFERRIKSIVVAVLVGGLYAGTLLNGVLPFQKGVSWDGHLIGAIAGALVALMTAKMMATPANKQGRSGSRYNNA